MHEISIVAEVMKTVKEVVEENNLTTVEAVVLDIGAICMAYPKYIEECFPAVVYKTEFENTKLEINIVQANAECRVCGEVFDIPKHDGVCPKCKADRDYEILSGTDLEIREIRAY